MSNPKGITIKLTDRQRAQLKGFTGENHTEMRIETFGGPVSGFGNPGNLASRSGLSSKSGLTSKSGLVSKSGLSSKSGLTSKSGLSKKF